MRCNVKVPGNLSVWLCIAASIAVIAIAGCGTSPTPTPTPGPLKRTPATAVPLVAQKSPDYASALPASEKVEGTISLDRNFYLVIDGSGSMSESACAGTFPNRIEAAKWAVSEFIRHSVPPEVNLGLYVFDKNGARERASLGKANRPLIIEEIKKIQAGGSTPLNQALKSAVDALVTQSRRQLDYGDFYVVVATDGEATDQGGPDARAGVLYAKQHAIPIISIGFCLKEDHPLSKESVSYRDVRNPKELFSALQETQAESTYFDTTVFEKK